MEMEKLVEVTEDILSLLLWINFLEKHWGRIPWTLKVKNVGKISDVLTVFAFFSLSHVPSFPHVHASST